MSLQSKISLYSDLYNLQETAQQLLNYAEDHKIWLLTGDLGVGKTTLVKAICAQLGVQDRVTSPTFALVHEYVRNTGELIYHLDAYRINAHEASVLDYQAYFESGCYCFIEWPTNIAQLIPPKHLTANLAIEHHTKRKIQASSYTDSHPYNCYCD